MLACSIGFVFGQEADSTDSEQNSSFALFPAFSYAPETSVQIGAVAIWVLNEFSDPEAGVRRQSTMTPLFLYTFRKQFIVSNTVDYFFKNGQNLSASVRWVNYPDFYYGLGNANDPDISESYRNRFAQLEGQFLHPITSKVFVGGGMDFQTNSIEDILTGGLLATDAPVGIDGGTLFGLGPAFRYDSRDYSIYPRSGYLVSGRMIYTGIGDFNYSSFRADFRKYLTIFNEVNILAFQVFSEFTVGEEVPFYKLPQLAGDNRLRGLTNASLYRDRNLFFTQVEYRRPLFWRFGMTLFAGIGDVTNEVGDYSLSEFKYVGGIGGRFLLIPEKQLNLRMDIGVGRGGQTGVYLGLSEAF